MHLNTCPPETHIKYACTHKHRYAHRLRKPETADTYVIQLLFFYRSCVVEEQGQDIAE